MALILDIPIGSAGHAEMEVADEHTAPRVGSGKIAVLATPVGMTVRATAKVIGVEGRTVKMRVRAEDQRDLVGEGLHERVVVNVERFDKRVQEKVALLPYKG